MVVVVVVCCFSCCCCVVVVVVVVVGGGGGGGTAAVGRKRLGDLCRGVCLSKIPSLSRFEPGTVRKRSILNCPSFSSWWLQFFLVCSPLLGEDSYFDEDFSKGLKPPTMSFFLFFSS